MGAFLEKPKTEKVVSKGKGYQLEWGVSAMQGWRMEMEDAHTCETKLEKLDKWSFFAVFDGHAGPRVSEYCSKHLLPCIMKTIPDDMQDEEKVSEKIKEGFLKIDEKLQKEPLWAKGEDRGGTTAITCMISPRKLIWANCGDSRGLLCRDSKLEYSTIDHKPVNEVERNRIEKAGGTVMMQRVNGSLAVSRALGDFDYKRATDKNPVEQLVSPEPEMHVMDRSDKDQFLLLACDGVFDVMTNDEIIAFVLHHLELETDLSKICSDLIDTCLNKNSRDNMSAILVTFPNAPKVSEVAIKKDQEIRAELYRQIQTRLDAMADEANDPMDMEENYVITQLNSELSTHFSEIYSERTYITEQIQRKKVKKFGKDANNFSTSSTDSSDFPLPVTTPPEFEQGPDANEHVEFGMSGSTAMDIESRDESTTEDPSSPSNTTPTPENTKSVHT